MHNARMVWEVTRRRGHVGLGPKVSGPWQTFEDMNAVTGWLLWSHRMTSQFGGMTGKTFAAAAREQGVPLSETEVSRAENGETDVAVTAIGKYERMLGMSPGTLSAPLRSAARLALSSPGGRRLSLLRSVPPSTDARRGVVNAFYQRYVDGDQFSGADWLMLVDAITGDEQSLLPDALAAQWIRMLLDECMRSVNPAYFSRAEALSTVAAHPRYGAFLLEATRELTAVPGVSGAPDAWSFLGDIRSSEVIDSLIAELPSVPDHRLMYYSIALSMPACANVLNARQTRAIAAELERRLEHWSLGSYEPIATLAAELPRTIGAPILQRIDNVHPLSRLTGRRSNRDVTAEVASYTKAAMDSTWPGHPHGSVLPELLRILLSSEQSGIRYHAATLIHCSPFAAAVCDVAADLSTSSPDALTRQLATYLVSRLATPDNDERLRLLLKNSDRRSLLVNTLTAMTHAGVITEQDDLRKYMKDKDLRYSAIYAAGITHHPDLYSTDADSDWATWWRGKRGGIWE